MSLLSKIFGQTDRTPKISVDNTLYLQRLNTVLLKIADEVEESLDASVQSGHAPEKVTKKIYLQDAEVEDKKRRTIHDVDEGLLRGAGAMYLGMAARAPTYEGVTFKYDINPYDKSRDGYVRLKSSYTGPQPYKTYYNLDGVQRLMELCENHNVQLVFGSEIFGGSFITLGGGYSIGGVQISCKKPFDGHVRYPKPDRVSNTFNVYAKARKAPYKMPWDRPGSERISKRADIRSFIRNNNVRLFSF